MTQQKQIAEAYRRRLESDYERICRTASASYHQYLAASPDSLFLYQDIKPGKAGTETIRVANMDYQIAKIELQPLHGDEKEGGYDRNVLELIAERRRRRGVSGDFEVELQQGNADLHAALHHYIHESTENDYNPRWITEQSTKVGSSGVEEPLIISIGGVYYVSKCITPCEYEDLGEFVKSEMENTHSARVDLWPDEVVIRGKTVEADQVYLRADVYFDENGSKADIRFRAS